MVVFTNIGIFFEKAYICANGSKRITYDEKNTGCPYRRPPDRDARFFPEP
jgi:hypothetical protein